MLNSDNVYLIPFGDAQLQNVGNRNCYAVAAGGECVIIDCGQRIPESDEDKGVHLFPDLSFLWESGMKVRAVLATHLHQDHIAGIPFLFDEYDKRHPDEDLPTLVGSRNTIDFIRLLLRDDEGKDIGFEFLQNVWDKGDIVVFPDNLPSRPLELGPFTIRAFPVPHSAHGSLGFDIRVGGKRVVTTGDFKIHSSNPLVTDAFRSCLSNMGDGTVNLLLVDSTGALGAGSSPADTLAADAAAREIKRTLGRVFIPIFAHQTDRMMRIVKAVRREEPSRRFYLGGRGLYKQFQAFWGCRTRAEMDARMKSEGLVFLDRHSWTKFLGMEVPAQNRHGEDIDEEKLIDLRAGVENEDAVIFLTGSQAEEGSSFALDVPALARVMGEDDTLLMSSSVIPEPANTERVKTAMVQVASTRATICVPPDNTLALERPLRANVRVGPFHTSGHSRRDEIAEVCGRVRPQVVAGIHGDPERREAIGSLRGSAKMVMLKGNVPYEI